MSIRYTYGMYGTRNSLDRRLRSFFHRLIYVGKNVYYVCDYI